MQAYERLEQEWAMYNCVNPAGMVACASGTAALHLALEALQLPPRSEVLMPDLTMVACPRAAVMAGLTPVFVDVDPVTLLMDWRIVNNHGWGEGGPPALMPVHLYGRKFDVESLRTCYPKSKIVEDLAEAHGIRPHPGSDAACWSFYRNKIVHGEEGGAVWFKDVKHAALARCLRSQGFTDDHDFMHIPRGHNYRMSNCHAQLIGESLLNIHNELFRRRLLEVRYRYHCPLEWCMPHRDVPWVFDIRIPGLTAEQQTTIVKTLNEQGIAARHAFKPMSIQPEFKGERVCGRTVGGAGYEESAALIASRQVLYFPLFDIGIDAVRTCFDVCRLVTGASPSPSQCPTPTQQAAAGPAPA